MRGTPGQFVWRFLSGFALGIGTIAVLLVLLFVMTGCASDVFSRLR